MVLSVCRESTYDPGLSRERERERNSLWSVCLESQPMVLVCQERANLWSKREPVACVEREKTCGLSRLNLSRKKTHDGEWFRAVVVGRTTFVYKPTA